MEMRKRIKIGREVIVSYKLGRMILRTLLFQVGSMNINYPANHLLIWVFITN